MSILSYLGILGGVISFMGYVPYARAIMRGEEKPERTSWLIWTLSNMLILLSYFVLGARTTIWVPLAYALGSAFITFLAFRYGQEGWGIFEKSALVVAIVGGVRWVFFDNVFFALIITMTVGFIAYIPRIRRLASDKSRKEDPAEWALFLVGGVFNLVAVSAWTYEIALLPVLIVFMNGIVLAFALRNLLWQSRHGQHEQTENISHE